MATKKGKVIKMPGVSFASATNGSSGPAAKLTPMKLRSNEWLRLLSIINKRKWGYPLIFQDERDYQEIKDIEYGKIRPYWPEKSILNAACTFFRGDKLCWIQDSESSPYRELTPLERRIWDIVGIKDLLGYIRPNGSIQAFVLSHWERIEPVLAEEDPEP